MGHVFYATLHGDRSKELSRFTMEKGRVLYVIYDEPSNPPPEDLADRTRREIQFMSDYLDTHGIRWR